MAAGINSKIDVRRRRGGEVNRYATRRGRGRNFSKQRWPNTGKKIEGTSEEEENRLTYVNLQEFSLIQASIQGWASFHKLPNELIITDDVTSKGELSWR